MSSPSGGTYIITDLGALPGGQTSLARGLANSQVVGTAETWNGSFHAFLLTGGQMQDLGTLGGLTSIATAVNSAGQAAGNAENPSGATRAFFYSIENISFSRYRHDIFGHLQDLGTLGGPDSSAAHIAPDGRVVGSARTASGAIRAVLWSDGRIVDLGTLGGPNSAAHAINTSGQIVGMAMLPPGLPHAFLYTGGAMHDLGTLGGPISVGNALNDSGQVAGASWIASGANHAFLYRDGAMHDLGTLGGTNSVALGIDSAGQVVGTSENAGGRDHAFLYNGAMTDLNNLIPASSDWELIAAHDLNEAGQITGYGSSGGRTRAFLLTPAGN